MHDEVTMESLNCAFCFKDLGFLTISQREAHYEDHFLNDYVNNPRNNPNLRSVVDSKGTASSSKTILEPREDKTSNRIWKFPKEKDIFWYPKQTTPPPSNYTPGLIPLIRKGLLKGQSRQLTRRAVLCNQQAVHIHREVWDAHWGCGYRNFLMTCAALMSQEQQQLYFPLLDTPLPPGIRNLQSWIESAWKEGFDPEGHKQLKNLAGTSKWIGTADLWVAFSSHGIPAELVDFDLRNNPQGLQTLINWVVDYFSVKETTDTSPKNAFESMKIPQIIITEKMPIILQHNGHSRTIIGYEIDKNGVSNLLSFDPAFRPAAELRTAALDEFAQHRLSTLHLEGEPSSSNLKRKRSDDIPRSPGKSHSNVLSTLKEGFFKSHTKSAVDLYAMTRKFRLDPKSLSKKKEYQILYFPMTAPLTDYEKSQRKRVTSTKLS